MNNTEQAENSHAALHAEILGIAEGRIAPASTTVFKKHADGSLELVGKYRGEEARKILAKQRRAALKERAAELKQTRRQLAMTQEQFARVLGVSTRTLQQWEQQRREPSTSAKVLLAIARKHPRIVKQAAKELALT